MEAVDIAPILTNIDFDPILVAALVAIVSILKRIFTQLHDRVAEVVAFFVAQALVFMQRLSEMVPLIEELTLMFLSGVVVWAVGKASYKGFNRLIGKGGYHDETTVTVRTQQHHTEREVKH
jgi:hypothetical protein